MFTLKSPSRIRLENKLLSREPSTSNNSSKIVSEAEGGL